MLYSLVLTEKCWKTNNPKIQWLTRRSIYSWAHQSPEWLRSGGLDCVQLGGPASGCYWGWCLLFVCSHWHPQWRALLFSWWIHCRAREQVEIHNTSKGLDLGHCHFHLPSIGQTKSRDQVGLNEVKERYGIKGEGGEYLMNSNPLYHVPSMW